MKILHVAESSRGGCGTYLNELAPLQIADYGLDNIRIIAPDRHLSQFRDIDPRTIRPFRRPGRAIGLAFLTVKLLLTIRKFRPDVIHAHSTFAGAISRVLSIFVPRIPPIIYCAHGWVFDTAQNPRIRHWMETVERSLSRRCAAIVCISNSEKARAEAAGIRPEMLIVAPNGIRVSLPDQTIADWEDDRLKVLFVGRLDKQKGVDVLLEAVQPLADSVTVRIIGEAVLSIQTKPTSSGAVEFLGWRDRDSIASQMRACDVVVMPSRWEGFGLVAIEAMRAGKPVVASAVGGLVEIIVDGVTGHLIPVDQPQFLRELLVSLTSAQLAPMGAAGQRRFLDLYSIERTHALIKSLYDTIVTAVRRGISLPSALAARTVSVHAGRPESVDPARSTS
jgi:glycosyltransferase involved in cell wall biosynthesis